MAATSPPETTIPFDRDGLSGMFQPTLSSALPDATLAHLSGLLRRSLVDLLQRGLLLGPNPRGGRGWWSLWALRQLLQSRQLPPRISWRAASEILRMVDEKSPHGSVIDGDCTRVFMRSLALAPKAQGATILLEFAYYLASAGELDMAHTQILGRIDSLHFKDNGKLHAFAAILKYVMWRRALEERAKTMQRERAASTFIRDGDDDDALSAAENDIWAIRRIPDYTETRALYREAIIHLRAAHALLPLDAYLLGLHLHLLMCKDDVKEAKSLLLQGGPAEKNHTESMRLSTWLLSRTTPHVGGGPGRAVLREQHRWLREDADARTTEDLLPHIHLILRLADSEKSIQEWRKGQRLLVRRVEEWSGSLPQEELSLWDLLATLTHCIHSSRHYTPDLTNDDEIYWAKRLSWWPFLLFRAYPPLPHANVIRRIYAARAVCVAHVLPNIHIPPWVPAIIAGLDGGLEWCLSLGVHISDDTIVALPPSSNPPSP